MSARIARAIRFVAVAAFGVGLTWVPFLVSAIRDGIIVIKP